MNKKETKSLAKLKLEKKSLRQKLGIPMDFQIEIQKNLSMQNLGKERNKLKSLKCEKRITNKGHVIRHQNRKNKVV